MGALYPGRAALAIADWELIACDDGITIHHHTIQHEASLPGTTRLLVDTPQDGSCLPVGAGR
jgi:hypothetical protein